MTAAINKKLSASLNELTATEIVAAINAGTTTCEAKPPSTVTPRWRLVVQRFSSPALQAAHWPQPIQG